MAYQRENYEMSDEQLKALEMLRDYSGKSTRANLLMLYQAANNFLKDYKETNLKYYTRKERESFNKLRTEYIKDAKKKT